MLLVEQQKQEINLDRKWVFGWGFDLAIDFYDPCFPRIELCFRSPAALFEVAVP